jgi:6-phosphofructokinase 1
VIPEEFPPAPIKLETVVRILEGAVVKRLAMNRGHGVAVIAEGVGARLDPADLEALSSAPRDEHGHVRLAEVPLGAVLRDAVRSSLGELGIKMTIVPKDVGYELRCADPTAFDLDYTRDLGAGAVRTLLNGTSGVMITRQGSQIVPIPFDEMMDPKTHKTRVRVVDVETESHGSARALQVRIEPGDLDDAKRLAQIADAAKLTPEQARERWAGAAIGLSG